MRHAKTHFPSVLNRDYAMTSRASYIMCIVYEGKEDFTPRDIYIYSNLHGDISYVIFHAIDIIYSN